MIFRDDDFDAVGVEDADGGVVESREGDLRDAAGEKCDAGALLADGGESAAEFLEEKWSFDLGEELFAVGETEEFEHAAESDEALQTGALVEPEEARERGDAIGVWENLRKARLRSDAREERALVVALDEGAGVLDEFAVLDGGGAGGFAGAAVEAFVDVLDEGFGDLGRTGGGVLGPKAYGPPGFPFRLFGEDTEARRDLSAEGMQAGRGRSRCLARSVWATWIIWWMRPRGESASRFQRR